VVKGKRKREQASKQAKNIAIIIPLLSLSLSLSWQTMMIDDDDDDEMKERFSTLGELRRKPPSRERDIYTRLSGDPMFFSLEGISETKPTMAFLSFLSLRLF